MTAAPEKIIRDGIWVWGDRSIVKDHDLGLVGTHGVDVRRHRIEEPHLHNSHSHTFYEMTYVMEGAGVHELDGKKGDLVPGTVYIIPPGVFHKVLIPKAMVWTNLLVKVEALPELFRGSEGMSQLLRLFYTPSPKGRLSAMVFRMEGADQKRMANLLEAYGPTMNHLPKGNPSYGRHLVMAILSLWASASGTKGGGKAEATILSLMTAVETLLDKGEDLSVKNLEGLTGVPLKILTSHFQKALGIGLAPYLLRRKIQRSLWLLSQGERMVHIADRLAFADGAHFSRTFKQVLGLSPRDYLEAMERGAKEGMVPLQAKSGAPG